MKKLGLITISLLLISFFSGCSNDKKNDTMEKTPAVLIDNMDKDISPGDNFFKYVNGSWMSENEIPDEYSQFGAFTELFENNQKQLQSLIEEVSTKENIPEGSAGQKIRDLYNSGMDTVAIEKAGISPISSDLSDITNLATKADIQNYIASMHKTGVNPLFYLFAEADQENSSMNIAYVYQGGIGLPDVDYYINDDDASKKLRADYLVHLTRMFELAGEDSNQAIEKANSVMNIETGLAKVSKSRLERRDPNANFNKMSVAELSELSPEFDWNNYFKNTGVNIETLNVSQPDFFAGISPLMQNTDVDDWKAYLTWNLLDNYANYLSDNFVQQNFEFYGKVLSGTPELQPRWKRVINNTSSRLGEALGQLYVEKFFPPEAKERMLALVENLRIAFADRIEKLDWMSDKTKVKALEKLNRISVKIGYPDQWKDYTSLEIVPDSYVQNIRNSRVFEYNDNIRKIGKPVDKKEWGMTPQTVNAYYNPSMNEIVFPAGILQPPFFNMHADDAVNYGAIGVVIGHEMTHGFDDQGRKYDKDGNLNDWWTEEDAKLFEAKTAKLIDQYNNYAILDTLNVDGNLTLGENIADLGGLNIAYNALQKAYNGNTPEPIEGFTADQRFFIGYAQVWRQNIRDKELIRRLKVDVHSPGDARVNVPPFNLDFFVDAFNISENSNLFIPVAERADIW